MPWPKGRLRPEINGALNPMARPESRAKISGALSPTKRADVRDAIRAGVPRGEGHHRWTEEPSYSALHRWVAWHRGSAGSHLCADCGGPASDWANVSGEYRRDLDDFIPLCRPCHWRFDNE
jgi:hypothetical protein